MHCEAGLGNAPVDSGSIPVHLNSKVVVVALKLSSGIGYKLINQQPIRLELRTELSRTKCLCDAEYGIDNQL